MACKHHRIPQTKLYRFRWVECQLDALRICKRPNDVRQSLKELPRTLDKTYDRILENIPEDDRRDVYSVIQMLAASCRPLTIDEVAEALAVDYENKTFDPINGRLMDKYEILKFCSSLSPFRESGRGTSSYSKSID